MLLDDTCVLYFATAPTTPGHPLPSSSLTYITHYLPQKVAGAREEERKLWRKGISPSCLKLYFAKSLGEESMETEPQFLQIIGFGNEHGPGPPLSSWKSYMASKSFIRTET